MAAAAAVPVLLSVLARRPWAGVLALVIAGALVASVAPRALRSVQPDVGGPMVRIMAANLRVGRAEPASVAAAVERADVDVFVAADQTGRGLRTTWPRGQLFPPPVTIDHVLVDRRIAVRDYAVVTYAGSDHRGVVADIQLPLRPDRARWSGSTKLGGQVLADRPTRAPAETSGEP